MRTNDIAKLVATLLAVGAATSAIYGCTEGEEPTANVGGGPSASTGGSSGTGGSTDTSGAGGSAGDAAVTGTSEGGVGGSTNVGGSTKPDGGGGAAVCGPAGSFDNSRLKDFLVDGGLPAL